MIGRLQGKLIEKTPPGVVVDVQGVGYLVHVPMSTFYDLPPLGDAVTLLIEMIVREDAQMLYGFLTAAERIAFRELIRVSGVGPRTALAVLSGLSVHELAQSVSAQEVARLTRIPGIGKKTAERLLLELKGRLAPELPGKADAGSGEASRLEVEHALIALGYSARESNSAAQALAPNTPVAEGIRQALRGLGKAALR
ncbi:MAG: Holliday junction branch migration protein RuvA [Betaproteobacteria bacterium]|nr:Holliday junction branch migration protein RuvA [Betaproteobacteria bacterium]